MGSFPETYDDPKFPGGERLSDHIPGTRVEFWLQNQMQEKVCHCKKEDEKVSFDKYTIKFHFLKAVFEELNFGGAYIRRGLSPEGNLIVFQNRLGLIYHFCFVEGNFPSTSPWGAYIWRGCLTKGFFITDLGGRGLIFGGAYTWRGLYMEGLIFGILHYFNALLHTLATQSC